jgi:hypothetical protein
LRYGYAYQHGRKKTGGKIHKPAGGAELPGIMACILKERMKMLGIQYGREK